MNEFPKLLEPDNKVNFEAEYCKIILSKLREDLCLHILSHKETDYYDLDKFRVNNHPMTVRMMNEMVKQLTIELNEMGWKTQTAYGNTGLFIYSGEKPVNCYEENF